MKTTKSILLAGCLVCSATVAAVPSDGSCPGFLERQWSNGIYMLVDASQTFAAVLPAKVHRPFFRLIDFSLAPFHDDWRRDFNLRVIESHLREMEHFDLLPSAKREKDLAWQARRLVVRHRPDLTRDDNLRFLPIEDSRLLLFVGAEDVPRVIPPHGLLVLHDALPVAWLRHLGNGRYSEWTSLTP